VKRTRRRGGDDGAPLTIKLQPGAAWTPLTQGNPPEGADNQKWLLGNEAAVASRVFLHQGDLLKAREHLEEAISKFARAGDRRQVLACQCGLGDVAVREGRLAEAIQIFERTSAEARGCSETDLEAIGLLKAGAIYGLVGEREIDRAYCQRAAIISPEIANTWASPGGIGAARPTPEAARSSPPSAVQPDDPEVEFRTAMLSAAEALLEADGSAQDKLFAYWSKGEALKNAGDFAAAVEAFAQGIYKGTEVPASDLAQLDHDILLSCTLSRAECCIYLGRLHHALEDLSKVFQRVPRPASEKGTVQEAVLAYQKEYYYVRCCSLAGEALLQLGRKEEARLSMEDALEICFGWQGLPLPRTEFHDMVNTVGHCAFSLGKLLVDSNLPEQALERLRMALSSFEFTRNEGGQAATHLDIANALGQIDKRKAGELSASGPTSSSPSTQVIQEFEKAAKLYEKIGDRAGLAAVYGSGGLYLLSNGWPAQAWSKFQEAAALHRDLGLIDGLVQDRINEARTCRALKLFDGAREALLDALQMASAHGLWDHEWRAAASLGDLELLLGDFDTARRHLEAALIGIEAQRVLLSTDDHRIQFAVDKAGVYELLVRVLLHEDQIDLAFLTVERSRSRALLDLMRNVALQPPPSLPAEWLTEEARLLDEVRAAELALASASKALTLNVPGPVEAGPGRRALHLAANEARTALSEFQRKVAAIAPEYGSLRAGDPASFEAAADLTRSDRRIVLVEYFVAGEEVHIFGIHSGMIRPEMTTLPLASSELGKFIRSNFGTHGKVEEMVADGFEELWHFYDYLLEPVGRWAQEGDTIYLIPHGPLHYLPLHALKVGHRYLIERNPVVYAPSSSVLKFCRAKRRRPGPVSALNALVLGDSRGDLPMARLEAEEVASLFGTFPLLGSEVDRATLNSVSTADLVHFAGHGCFDVSDPLNSGLLLANNEVLTARDVFNLRGGINARLVALSGCETGVSEHVSGDELLGLMRAFLFAGASSLMLSLWRVDDESTAFLMSNFYTLLQCDGPRVATVDALREAVLATKANYPSLDQWAPFILVGDWA